MFLDRVKIWVRGGDGGDGAATFRREAHVPRGGPDGGDGGRGGSIYLVTDPGETMLRDYQHKHHFRGEAGGRGSGDKRHGKAGGDLILKVPPGTGVFDDGSGALLADLVSRAAAGARRARRARRARERALRHVHAPDAAPRAERRTRRRALDPPRAPVDRGDRAGRAAERGQVHAAGGADCGAPEDRRLPVHDPRAQPRRARPLGRRR